MTDARDTDAQRQELRRQEADLEAELRRPLQADITVRVDRESLLGRAASLWTVKAGVQLRLRRLCERDRRITIYSEEQTGHRSADGRLAAAARTLRDRLLARGFAHVEPLEGNLRLLPVHGRAACAVAHGPPPGGERTEMSWLPTTNPSGSTTATPLSGTRRRRPSRS